MIEGFAKQCSFAFDNSAKINSRRREVRKSLDLIICQQSVFDEPVRADQQSISGERGETLIGRVAVAGGPKRQDLPVALPGRREKVYEGVCLIPEVADPEAPWQRCRV